MYHERKLLDIYSRYGADDISGSGIAICGVYEEDKKQVFQIIPAICAICRAIGDDSPRNTLFH